MQKPTEQKKLGQEGPQRRTLLVVSNLKTLGEKPKMQQGETSAGIDNPIQPNIKKKTPQPQ